MRIPITVPDFQLGEEPLRLGEWSVEIGDAVDEGECLAELICPGLAVDLLSPTTGTIADLLRQPEQPVTTGDVLGWVETAAPES